MSIENDATPEAFAQRPTARRSDPLTSHEAATSVQKRTQTQRVILAILAAGFPMTDPNIKSEWLGGWHFDRGGTEGVRPPSDSGLRTRRKELVELGFIEDSGEREEGVTGRKFIRWRITADGLAFIRGGR